MSERFFAPMALLVVALVALTACETPRAGLALDRVVLYRNGVGYFERTGTVDGDELRIKCQRDQVDDVLKSLTVVDRSDGVALSVSMPLDPETWANAAMAMLGPGQGNLSHVLDSLRGTPVTLVLSDRSISGRILMVDRVEGANGPEDRISLMDEGVVEVALLSHVTSMHFGDDELAMQLHRSLDASAGEGMFQQVEVVVRLSEQAEHEISLSYVVAAPIWKPTYRVVLPEDPKGKALLQGWAVVDNTSGEDWDSVNLSLTSGAPIAFRYDLHTPKIMHRPDMSHAGTAKLARVAVGETSSEPEEPDALDALLGDGNKVGGLGGLGTTGHGGGGGGGSGYGRGEGGFSGRSVNTPKVASGRPTVMGSLDKNVIQRVIRRHRNEIKYCYERELERDGGLAGKLSVKITIGPDGKVQASTTKNSTLGNSAVEQCVNKAVNRWVFPAPKGGGLVIVSYPFTFSPGGPQGAPADDGDAYGWGDSTTATTTPFGMDELAESTMAKTSAKRVAGLTQFELTDRVTVPGGSSTMVAIVNAAVEAEQVFLFKPGGSGAGYETNPYRVVRVKNDTPFVLEPGPISIYAGGSFVGEGISETIAAGATTTVPFSVEPSISVTSVAKAVGGTRRLVKVNKGILTVEWYEHQETEYKVSGPPGGAGYRVLVRHPRYGSRYELQNRPEGTEEVGGAYLIPLDVADSASSGSVKVVERTPSTTTMTIWDRSVPALLETFMGTDGMPKGAVAKLKPIVDARKAIADIDQEVWNLKKRQRELDDRANQIRLNLEAIKKDPAAGGLRARLNKKLEGFTKEGDKLGREVVELTSKRLEKKIELDEALAEFSFDAPNK